MVSIITFTFRHPNGRPRITWAVIFPIQSNSNLAIPLDQISDVTKHSGLSLAFVIVIAWGAYCCLRPWFSGNKADTWVLNLLVPISDETEDYLGSFTIYKDRDDRHNPLLAQRPCNGRDTPRGIPAQIDCIPVSIDRIHLMEDR